MLLFSIGACGGATDLGMSESRSDSDTRAFVTDEPIETAAPLPPQPSRRPPSFHPRANQRYWLCMDGAAVSDEIPMTTASGNDGLPPVGTYEVIARDEDASGIGGEALERFVAFYTAPKGNRIAFHEVVKQDPDTVGDLDQRGASAAASGSARPIRSRSGTSSRSATPSSS
jgi:hypothetical protein